MDAWTALALQPHIGTKTLRALMAHFGSAEAVLDATVKDLKQVSGVGAITARRIADIDLDQLNNQHHTWTKQGITLLTPDHPAYPTPLTGLDDAPCVLFALGKPRLGLWAKTVAIVGTRSPEPHMQALTQGLALRLAQEKNTIVSGLALGIDTYAHLGALAATHGHTVAVMGSGVLNVYPSINRPLAQQVAANGLILSEVLPDVDVTSAHLVARNRIISGLSRAVIVVQTEVDGGAMHAARMGAAQGRTIYAIDLPYSGNRQLIRDGAIPLSPLLVPWPFNDT
jgi:DNA processing protein